MLIYVCSIQSWNRSLPNKRPETVLKRYVRSDRDCVIGFNPLNHANISYTGLGMSSCIARSRHGHCLTIYCIPVCRRHLATHVAKRSVYVLWAIVITRPASSRRWLELDNMLRAMLLSLPHSKYALCSPRRTLQPVDFTQFLIRV